MPNEFTEDDLYLLLDYWGTYEVAKYCKVTKQAVWQWRKRGKMPEPVAKLKMGPVWKTKDIMRWWNESWSYASERGRSK